MADSVDQSAQGRNERTSDRSLKAVIQIALVVILVLVVSERATAQTVQSLLDIDSPGLLIEAVAGWGGVVDRTAPVPVSFLIHNGSDRNIDGVLTLVCEMTGQEESLGEVLIAPGTMRRVSSIQSLTDWYDCHAKLSQRGKILWRRELDMSVGRKFSLGTDYVLFIDDIGRKLPLPGALSDGDRVATPQTKVAGIQGLLFQCLAVKPWQIPNHFGALFVARAIVFPDAAPEKSLNQVQWKAIAEWMCQGGTVFVHDQSHAIIDRLVESAPLGADAAFEAGPFKVRRIGLGAIYEYSHPLLSPEGDETRRAIAETAAKLRKNHINTFADSGYLPFTRAGRANQNRFIVGVFFSIYTLLTGGVTLFLFRLSRKQIAAYVIAVVIGASILSGLLGGLLRHSKGDLHWITVTQAGFGGLIQVGSLELQSAGGRNSRVAIQGEHADLQMIAREQHYDYRFHYYGYGTPQQSGYSPFTWQRNLANDEDACQIDVPMTLWGRRRCHATAFKRGLQRMEFELDFKPDNPKQENQEEPKTPSGLVQGEISIKLVNHLPFEIKDCWLVIGVTQAAPSASNSINLGPGQRPQFGPGVPQSFGEPVDGKIVVYHEQRLPNIPAGTSRDEKFHSSFQDMQYNWQIAQYWPHGSDIPPRVSRVGAASAWIFGRIDDFSIMTIDQKNSDFIPYEHFHLFIQEILPEDLSDAFQFTDAEKQPAIDAVESQPR